jgi:uncharacterized membrane protein
MADYLARALGAWFVGFFPLAEIYVAVPAALAVGLDHLSTVFWTVFGNFTPLLLIHFGYNNLLRLPRLRRWLESLVSERAKRAIDRYGVWFVLLLTPWTGVWVMGVTAKALRMKGAVLLGAGLISITVYAVALVFLINAGVQVFDQ